MRAGPRRVATHVLAAIVAVGALSSCSTPPGLDHDERVAFARACVSLIERNLSDNKPPRIGVLDKTDLNLDDPQQFYSQLEHLRGPSAYNLHDPAHETDTGRQPLDRCDTDSKPLSSLFPSSSTTTTTTATTVPGS